MAKTIPSMDAWLAEAKKEGGPGLKVCPPLIIRQDGQETEAFRRNYRLEETI